MYIYKKEQLKKMEKSKLAKLNEQLDTIAKEIELEWDEELILLSKSVDQATTEEECNRRFVNYLLEKQIEVRDGFNNYITDCTLPIEIIVNLLTIK